MDPKAEYTLHQRRYTDGKWAFEKTFFITSCCWFAKSCLILGDPMDCSTLGFPVLHYLWEFAQIHVHWIGDAIQPSHLLLSPSHLAFNLSQHQGLFWWVGSSHQVAKLLELQFSISPSSEYSGLISFQIDCFDLLVETIQGTLKSLLQHHTLKTSILRCSAFLMIQVSPVHDYWKHHSFDHMDICQQSDVFAV